MDWVWFLVWLIVGFLGGVGLIGYYIWAALQLIMWLLAHTLVRSRLPLGEWLSRATFSEWGDEREYYRRRQRIALWVLSWALWLVIGVWIWL